MRKLIVQRWVTVNNIAAEEDGGLSFVSGEPFSETDTSAFKASVMGFIDSVDTLILGANTYAQSKGCTSALRDQEVSPEALQKCAEITVVSGSACVRAGGFSFGGVGPGR
jgi:hypothetical protein